jgi:lipopolysaccharide transport system permease protein
MNRSSQLFLLRELVRRDFSQRYAGSLFGFAWSFIQPLWQMALLSYVFSLIMRADLSTEETRRFWVFLFCGLLPWTAIHEGILRSATVVVEHAEMVKKIAFPAEILVIAVTATALIHQVITLVVFLGALALVGELSWGSLWLLPFAFVLQVLMTIGIGYFVAAIQVYFRDAAQLLGLLINAWFYLTPIVYPLAMIPERYQDAVMSNPLAILVTLYRHAFLGGDTQRWTGGLLLLASTTLLFFAGGLAVFQRLKPGFSDEI